MALSVGCPCNGVFSRPEHSVGARLRGTRLEANRRRAAIAVLLCFGTGLAGGGFQLSAQMLLKPASEGERVNPLPSDVAILESDARKDLPCSAVPRKPDLGFDLRFHTGYDVTIPLNELSGEGSLLTVVFRAYPEGATEHASYFVQKFRVPAVEEDAKGDALLAGYLDLGPGKYHFDWLIRDRMERICSSSWDVEAALSPKDRSMPLFIAPNEIAQSAPEPFVNDGPRSGPAASDGLKVKLLVNFAPQDSQSATLQRSDTEALVSIMKSIERDPHVNRISLVAFNMGESRIVYRQESDSGIDFAALGKALHTVKLGTVTVQQLGDKHSETDFLQQLIETEVAQPSQPDAVIFAGPKAMLNADVPQSDLRRIGEVECPVFYMNYNLNPQAVPWKDSISHAIRAFNGTEYTISRPRDLWTTTSEMLNRIVRNKRQRTLTSALGGSH